MNLFKLLLLSIILFLSIPLPSIAAVQYHAPAVATQKIQNKKAKKRFFKKRKMRHPNRIKKTNSVEFLISMIALGGAMLIAGILMVIFGALSANPAVWISGIVIGVLGLILFLIFLIGIGGLAWFG